MPLPPLAAILHSEPPQRQRRGAWGNKAIGWRPHLSMEVEFNLGAPLFLQTMDSPEVSENCDLRGSAQIYFHPILEWMLEIKSGWGWWW